MKWLHVKWLIFSAILSLISCSKKQATFLQSIPNGPNKIKIEPRWQQRPTLATKFFYPVGFGLLGSSLAYGYYSEHPFTITSTVNNVTKVSKVPPATMGYIGGGLGIIVGWALTPERSKSVKVNPAQYDKWLKQFNKTQRDPYFSEGYQDNFLLLSRNPTITKPAVVVQESPKKSQSVLANQEDTPVLTKRYALLIGNGAYQTATQLHTAVSDIDSIANRLKQVGFDITKKSNLTKTEFEKTLREFNRQVKNADVALFYYVGHGMGNREDNYLMPVDAVVDNPGDIRTEGIRLNEILDEMGHYGTKINLVYLDACQKVFKSTLTQDYATRGFKVIGQTPPSISLYCATEPSKTSETPKGRNGYFTEAFLKHIKPNLDSDELMQQITQDVIQNTNGKQIPWSAGSATVRFSY